jgi:GNAT superfamily N-acetyltransferase
MSTENNQNSEKCQIVENCETICETINTNYDPNNYDPKNPIFASILPQPILPENIEIIHISKENYREYFDTVFDDIVVLFSLYVKHHNVPHPHEVCKSLLTRRLEAGSQLFCVYKVEPSTDEAQLKKIPIAYSQLYPTWLSIPMEDNWILNDLFVKSEFRDLKMGTKLIEYILYWAEQYGSFQVRIETMLNNERARYLYPKLGFTEFCRHDDSIHYKYTFQRAKNKFYNSYYE